MTIDFLGERIYTKIRYFKERHPVVSRARQKGVSIVKKGKTSKPMGRAGSMLVSLLITAAVGFAY